MTHSVETPRFTVTDPIYRKISGQLVELQQRIGNSKGCTLSPDNIVWSLQRILEGEFGNLESQCVYPVNYAVPFRRLLEDAAKGNSWFHVEPGTVATFRGSPKKGIRNVRFVPLYPGVGMTKEAFDEYIESAGLRYADPHELLFWAKGHPRGKIRFTIISRVNLGGSASDAYGAIKRRNNKLCFHAVVKEIIDRGAVSDDLWTLTVRDHDTLRIDNASLHQQIQTKEDQLAAAKLEIEKHEAALIATTQVKEELEDRCKREFLLINELEKHLTEMSTKLAQLENE